MYDLDMKMNCKDCQYLFLPNLRWATDTPKYILPMHEHLIKRLGKVGMILHGWDDTEEEAFNKLKNLWEELNQPILIIGNARLYLKALQEFPKEKVASYWYILADYGLPPAPHTHSNHFKPVLVFDPWYFKDDEQIQMYVRDILLMCNYEDPADLDLAYKKATEENQYKETFVKEAAEIKRPIITYCNNARDYLAGKEIPVIHVLDMIFSNTDEKTQKHPPFNDLEKARNIELLKAEIAASHKKND